MNLGGNEKQEIIIIIKKMFSVGFKLVRSVLLVFLSVKLEEVGGGIGFTFLPSCATLFAVVQPPV